MEKAKIKISTVDKIFKFLKKQKGEEIPQAVRYLLEPIPFEIAKENLSVTTFNNGDPIPEAKTKEEWVHFGKEKVPAFMRYGNHLHYNHFAVTDKRGICPPGWKVPTEEDLLFIMHRKLYKNFPLVGYRDYYDGSVSNDASFGDYWSSTVAGSVARGLLLGSDTTDIYSNFRGYGFSIRCVRDKK